MIVESMLETLFTFNTDKTREGGMKTESLQIRKSDQTYHALNSQQGNNKITGIQDEG